MMGIKPPVFNSILYVAYMVIESQNCSVLTFVLCCWLCIFPIILEDIRLIISRLQAKLLIL